MTQTPLNAIAEDKNPLRQEMRLLDRAMGSLFTAIALDEPKSALDPFQKLHHAREKTEAALERKELRLPKSNDNIKLFKQLDANFHKELEYLVNQIKAGNKDEVKATAKRMLDSCIECHKIFRE